MGIKINLFIFFLSILSRFNFNDNVSRTRVSPTRLSILSRFNFNKLINRISIIINLLSILSRSNFNDYIGGNSSIQAYDHLSILSRFNFNTKARASWNRLIAFNPIKVQF